ncbi:hypothetical protein TUM17384_36150 [Shewanella algae]|nr:hypothetical protein TUM17384_36150 [Shewanella algae]
MSKNLLASLNSSLFSTPWAIFVDSHLIEGQKSPVNPICRNPVKVLNVRNLAAQFIFAKKA